MLMKTSLKRLTALLIIFIFATASIQPAVFGAAGNEVIDVVATGTGNSAGDGDGDTVDGADAADEAGAPDIAESAAPAGPAVGSPAGYSDLSASYTDLTQDEKAEILNRLGMLLGDPDRGLMLDIKVRRSDAAVFFTRLLGQEQYVKDRSTTDFATSRFPDAPEGMWYTPYISYCTSIGIIAGRTDGYYYPDDNISEKEFANVLLKILGYEYEVDYNWDNVYEFSYDVGLFEDPAYLTRKEDNRDYYRRDVCDQVFAVLGLEKKNSSKLLIEELVETGAISEQAAADLGFDLSGLSRPGPDTNIYPEDADIYGVYHLEPDLLWVVFTKPVTFRDEAVEICQTYDYSKVLSVRVEEKSNRDALLRTGEQLPGMDYTIDISNVIEPDGTNAGMLSFDFTGYDAGAAKDTPGGLTSLKRDINALPGTLNNSAPPSDTGSGEGDAPGADAASGAAPGDGAGDDSGGAGEAGNAGGAGALPASTRPAGNADPSVDYFRITNAFTTASNELVVYFSHPISETALNVAYYNIVQGNSILCSGSAGQIQVELVENTINAVRLIASGATFSRGAQYRVTVSGRLTSVYTARMNEGVEDYYTFVAENVAERVDSFTLDSINTISQYGIELEFSQPIDASTARQTYNYQVLDQNNRKMDISSVSLVAVQNSVSGAASSGESRVVRISLTQPLLTHQDCSLTIIYAQNSKKTASIANQTYQFQYGGQSETVQKSPLALTGAISNDPATAELYFSLKLDPVSAVITSNYSINGYFDGKSLTANPVKVSYDPVLSPYMVRLYFPVDRRFSRDHLYSIRISNSIRDEKKQSPDRTLEMQFYANNRDSATPVLKDAVIVGEGIVRLDFSKEILFDPAIISEGNFILTDIDSNGANANLDSQLSPILVKYIDTSTIILRFDSIDISRKYNARFNAITDYSGLYTTRYPDQGSSVALRNGKR